MKPCEGCDRKLPKVNGIHLEIFKKCTNSVDKVHGYSSGPNWRYVTQCNTVIDPSTKVTRHLNCVTCVTCMKNVVSFLSTIVSAMEGAEGVN
jgi:predicted aldo/keto reductase-like oxidoreductase